MITIYAEKPDVARKIAVALGKIKLNDGTVVTYKDINKYEKALKAIQAKNGFFPIQFKGEKCAVTYGFGHLCALWELKDYDEDFKNWSNIDYPYIPSNYNIKVMPVVKKQFDIVKKLFNSSDYIINATDWDREGEVIFSYVYEASKCKKPYKRVYYNSQTEEAFVNAFNDLRDASEVKNLEQAGRCRGIADWLIGMNLTVAATVNSHTKGVLNIGRVQTPTLAMVVEREKAIRNFKKEKYYVPVGTFTLPSGETYKGEYNGKIKSPDEAEAIVKKLSGRAVVKSVETKEEKVSTPSLFSLSILQMEANGKFGYTADKTLQIVQELYEGGYVTYPRTSSAFLPEDYMPQAARALKALEKLPQYERLLKDVPRKFNRRYFNDKKVESHFAIVPTHVAATKLDEDKGNIYDLICKSLINTIYPPAVVLKTKIITEDSGVEFVSKGSIVKDPGWMVVGGIPKENNLPALKEKDKVSGKYETDERQTEPPKRYTDKTLIAAMMSADKDADEKDIMSLADLNITGIGQESTRASIIDKLVKTGYLERKKKSFYATDKGIALIDNLPIDDIKSATLTAKWETRLNDVALGKEKADTFIKGIELLTSEWCNIIKTEMIPVTISSGVSDSGVDIKCPICGSPLRKFEWGFGCSGYKSGCQFHGTVAGKKLTKTQIEQLAKNGRTGVIKGFKSKAGKTFNARLKIEDNKIIFDFEE